MRPGSILKNKTVRSEPHLDGWKQANAHKELRDGDSICLGVISLGLSCEPEASLKLDSARGDDARGFGLARTIRGEGAAGTGLTGRHNSTNTKGYILSVKTSSSSSQ